MAFSKSLSQGSKGNASTLPSAPFSIPFRILSILLVISSIFSGWALAVPEPECKTFCTIKNPSEGILATTNNPSPFFIVTFEPADTQPSQERTRVVDLSTGLAVVPGGNFIFSSLPESTNRVAVIKYDFPDSLPTGKYKIFAASIYNVDGAVPPHEETFIIDVSPPSLDTFEAFEGAALVTSDNKQNVSFGENTPIQIKVKASDKDGGLTDFVPETTVKQVAFYLNGQPQAAAIGADGSVSFSLSKPLGYYTGIIHLSDTLGTASEATFNFSVVDRTGPGISLRFPPGGKTVQDTEQLVFDLTEPSACILQREGSTEEIGTSTRSTVAEFTGVFIDTPAGGIIDNVISSFSVTCKDDSGNENTASVPITFIARAPRIMDLRSSRGDRINAFLKGKITSLHAETNSDASCFFKGGRFPLEPPDGEPEDPQSGMASFGKSGKLHDIDLTGRIIGGGIIDAQYTFYVRCRELGSEILTLVNNTNFTVNLNLRITDIAPSGVISSKSPSLFINLTRPALCRKVGDSDSFEQVVRQEYTLSMGQFEDGPHSVEVECSLNDRYSEKVSETISFTVDSQTIAPVIFSIQDALGREVLGSATNNRAITVQGTAEQGANVSVLVKDAAGSIVGEISTIAGQGIFTAGFILPEQGNTFSIESKATDAAGNVASGSPVAVTLDTTGPGDIVLDRIPSPTKESIAVVSGKTEADARVMLLDKDSIEVKDITFSTPKEKLFIVTTPAKDSVRGSKVLRFEGLLDQLFTQGRFIQIEDSLDRIKIGEVAATSTFGLKATKVTLVEGLPEDVIKDTTLIKVFNTSIPEGRFSLSIPVESQANEFNVRAVDSFENPSANDVPFTIILDQIVPRAAPLTSGTMGNNKTIIKVKLDGTGSSIDESSIGMAIRGPCSASGLRAPVEKGSLTFDNITGILSYQNDAAKLCNDGEYPDGTYSVAIGAKDAAGNILPDSSGWEFTIDTKLPSDPQFTVVDGIKKENTQWFKKSDGATIYAEFFESSISLIEIRADGIVLQSGTGFFKDSGNPNRIRIELPAIGSGTHIISVRAAKQSFQNAQTTANEATFTLKVVIDSTAPAVALSGPAITQSREVAITLAAVDENLKEIRLGGDSKRASQAPQVIVPLFIEGSQRLIKVNLTVGNGTKTIQAAAEDFVGNIQTKEITIILDQEAPSSSLSLTDSLGNALVQEGVELVTGDNTIIISCACADPLAGCDDQKTIRGVKEKGSQTAAVVSGTAFTAGAGSGDKFLEVSCATQDNAGNLGEASVFVKIDRSAPQITVIEPVTGFTNKRINTLKLQTDDTAACFISSRSDFLQPFITKIPSSDMKLHIQPIDLKDKDANFDKDNPKTFAFYVQCNNSFGLKSPVTPIPITIDTTPLVITEISAAKPPFFIDDFQNTITVKTNKPAKCRFGDNVNNLGAGSFGTFAQLPESFVEEFSIARTLTRDFFNGIHSIRFDCMDKAGNLAANPSSFTFTVNVNEPLQSFGTAPSGRIADRTPDLAVKLNKQGSCRFNGSAATLIHKSLESGRELTVNAFNITALQRDGFHSFAVACNDLEDNYIYPLIEFFINTTPPEKPLIAQPSENEMFKNGLTVAGTAQDGVALINLFIDGSFVKSQAVLNGNFESTINATLLAEGAHVLEAEAEFPDGKEFRSGRSRTNIWKDTISNPPALIQPQLTTPIERFLVRGTSEPDAKVFIFREPSAAGAQAGTQGTPAAAQPQSLIPIGEGAADVNGDFTINIALVSGENLLFARAMDRSDNPLSEKSTQLRVMFDNLGPELSVTKPGNFANTNAFEVRVQAKDISNVTKATLTINTTPPSIIPIGASQLGREETTILEALTISNNGSFILTVDAEDIYGNKAAVIHPFILDTSVPDPAAFNLDGKTINIRNPVLEFNFTDEVKIVRLGGIAATPIAPSNARQFRYSASNLEDGNYNIFIVASSLNGAGGEGNFTFSFVVDATPPMVTADMPDKTTVEAIIIKGSCGDNLSPSDQVQLTVFQAGQLADNPFSCAGNSYSTQINLDGGDGFKFIEVRARDKAGNTNTAAKLITLDTVVPEIIITDIANNPQLILGRMPLQTSIESVTLRGMVRDDNLATLSVLQNNVSVPKVSLRAQQGTVQSVFEANISLAGIPGEERVNTIEIIAVDTFGQIGKQSLNITKDLAGPNITSFVPPTFSVHDAQPILSLATHETSEKCSLTYPLQVTSGVKTEEFISNDKRSFFVALSTPIRNIAGSTSAQSISINCTDSLGNTATHLRTLQVDFEDPQVASFDIDYFEKTFVQGNVDSKTFLITKIPAGAGLRLSAETNEDAQCAFKEGSAIIPFASDGVSDTGLFVRAHQTGIIPIDDITNRSFLIGCRDKSGRLSLQKEIKLIINSVVGLDAPLIILQNPPYSSLGIAAAAFSNRTVVFEGSITSLTLGVQIDAAQLAIAGTTSSIPLEVNGHFQKTVGPLPSDGIFNFTVFANNTRGNKTFLKGAVSIDTEGPGGCVTINNARSCSAIGQAKILAQQLASASVSSPSSGPIPVCGDNICSFREHCFIDCLVTDIPIFSAAGEMVNPDGTILFSGVYEDNQTNVFFAKVLVANTSSLILQELNSTLVSEHLVSKVNVLNQPAFFNGKNAVWQARQGNNHYLIFIYSEDSQSDIPSLILQRYFSKYPSVLT